MKEFKADTLKVRPSDIDRRVWGGWPASQTAGVCQTPYLWNFTRSITAS